MAKPPLSRREREIMDVLHAGEALTVADVQKRMPDPPSYSSVRALLRILEDKGHVRHEAQGPRYLYSPVVSRAAARRSALKALVETFFDGSPAQAAAALLDDSRSKLSGEELDRIAEIITKARKEGR